MTVVECDVPAGGALGRELIERADFRDAYRVPLRHPDLGVVDIFFEIFAHRPAWMTLMLIARNKVAALAGLETPTTSEVMTLEKRDRYAVGEKIGPWPIFFLGADELVAGRDNKHMDFRLSIMKVTEAACWAHGRRKFFALAELTKAPLALEAVRRIDAIFAIERQINGQSAVDRLARRQVVVAPLVADSSTECAPSAPGSRATPRSRRRSTTCSSVGSR